MFADYLFFSIAFCFALNIASILHYTVCLPSEFSWNFYLSPPNFCLLGLNKIKLFSL